MTRAPFESINTVPRWKMILDVITPLEVDEAVTFDQLNDAAGIDVREVRGDLYRAIQTLESDHHRTMESVRTVGYRVVAANEHGRLAKKHHKKSRRQIDKAIRKADSSDRSKLTEVERREIDSMGSTLRSHRDMIRRLELRVDRTEARLQLVEQVQDKDASAQASRIDALEEALRRHGIGC